MEMNNGMPPNDEMVMIAMNIVTYDMFSRLECFMSGCYPVVMHIFIVLNRLLFSRIDMRKLMQRHYLMSGGYYF